jgi:hypothetical protein
MEGKHFKMPVRRFSDLSAVAKIGIDQSLAVVWHRCGVVAKGMAQESIDTNIRNPWL